MKRRRLIAALGAALARPAAFFADEAWVATSAQLRAALARGVRRIWIAKGSYELPAGFDF